MSQTADLLLGKDIALPRAKSIRLHTIDPVTREGVIAAYKRLGSIKAVCAETGCAPYNAYIWLRVAGVLRPGDKRSYGTGPTRLGAAAEEEFQRLVPDAMSANDCLDGNNPSFDFAVGKITIDVKYSAVRPSRGNWGFDVAHDKHFAPDFYCAFFAFKQSLEGGYHLFLMPHEIIGTKAVFLRPADTHSQWWQFLVKPADLVGILREAAA